MAYLYLLVVYKFYSNITFTSSCVAYQAFRFIFIQSKCRSVSSKIISLFESGVVILPVTYVISKKNILV